MLTVQLLSEFRLKVLLTVKLMSDIFSLKFEILNLVVLLVVSISMEIFMECHVMLGKTRYSSIVVSLFFYKELGEGTPFETTGRKPSFLIHLFL